MGRNGCRVIIRIETGHSNLVSCFGPRIRALARYFTSAFASVKYLSQRPHPRAKTRHKFEWPVLIILQWQPTKHGDVVIRTVCRGYCVSPRPFVSDSSITFCAKTCPGHISANTQPTFLTTKNYALGLSVHADVAIWSSKEHEPPKTLQIIDFHDQNHMKGPEKPKILSGTYPTG